MEAPPGHDDVPRPPSTPPPRNAKARSALTAVRPNALGSGPARPLLASRSDAQREAPGGGSEEPPAKVARIDVSGPALTVYSTNHADDTGMSVLVSGDYEAQGIHHGCPWFKKLTVPLDETDDIFIYFWDSRDGEPFNGWWFGNELGGSSAWLQNKTCSLQPPRTGWIWQDGSVRGDLIVARIEDLPPQPNLVSRTGNGKGRQPQWSSSGARIPHLVPAEAHVEGDRGEATACWETPGAHSMHVGSTRASAEAHEGGVFVEAHASWEEPDAHATHASSARAWGAQSQGQEGGAVGGPGRAWRSRYQACEGEVLSAEANTREVLDMTRRALSGSSDTDGPAGLDALTEVDQLQEYVSVQMSSLEDVHKNLTEEAAALRMSCSGGAAPAEAHMVHLIQRVQKLQGSLRVAALNLKLKRRMEKVEHEAGHEAGTSVQREEGRNVPSRADGLEAVAEEKLQALEDEVKSIAAAASALDESPTDDLKDIMLSAVRETEERCKSAAPRIEQATRFFNDKKLQLKSTLGFNKLHCRLEAVVERFRSLQDVRKTFEHDLGNQNILKHLNEKAATAEEETEVALVVKLPASANGSEERVIDAQRSLETARAAVLHTKREVERSLRLENRTPNSRFHEEVNKIGERMLLLQENLDEGAHLLRETQAKDVSASQVEQVCEQANAIEAELFLMEEFQTQLHATRVDEAVCVEAESLASKATDAILHARSVFVQRCDHDDSGEAGEEMQSAVSKLQASLETGQARIQGFLAAVIDARRRRSAGGVAKHVEEAERAAAELKQLVAETLLPLGSAIVPGAEEQVGAAAKTVAEAAKATQGTILAARKVLLAGEAELRSVRAGRYAKVGESIPPQTEFARLQARLAAAEQEASSSKTAAKDVEDRLRVRKLLSDVIQRVTDTEAEVERAVGTAEALVAAAGKADTLALAHADKALSAASGKLEASVKYAEAKQKAASSSKMKAELANLLERLATSSEMLKLASKKRQGVQKIDSAVCAGQETVRKESAGIFRLVEITEAAVKAAVSTASSRDGMQAPIAASAKLSERARGKIESTQRVLELKLSGATDPLQRQELEKCQERIRAATVTLGLGEARTRGTSGLVAQPGPGLPGLTKAPSKSAVSKAAAAAGRGHAGLGVRRKCALDILLQQGRDPESEAIRWLCAGEFVELLDGPVEVPHVPGMVLNGIAVTDSAAGWIALQGPAGEECVSNNGGHLFKCKAAVAMTDGLELAESRILRKVTPGEVLELLEDYADLSNGGLHRQPFRTLRDGIEGWVTVRGTQGQLFLIPTQTCYILQKPRILWQGTDPAMVRPMQAGEAFDASEAPRPIEAMSSRLAVRVRASQDSATGWVSWSQRSYDQPLLVAEEPPVCHADGKLLPVRKAPGYALPLPKALGKAVGKLGQR